MARQSKQDQEKESRNKARRDRYKNDPDFRERVKAASRAAHERARRAAGVKPRATNGNGGNNGTNAQPGRPMSREEAGKKGGEARAAQRGSKNQGAGDAGRQGAGSGGLLTTLDISDNVLQQVIDAVRQGGKWKLAMQNGVPVGVVQEGQQGTQ